MTIDIKRAWVVAAATMMIVLSSMAHEASAAIISDQTQLVTEKGTVQLIIDQFDPNTYQATLNWNPIGYTGGATDYISNVAIKLTSDTSDESLIADPNGTWDLDVDAASNFGTGCGGNDSGSLCAKTTDVTNTTNASRTWVFQFDTSSLFDEYEFHVQVQFHESDAGPAGQISTLFTGGSTPDPDPDPDPVPAPATLSLLGLGLVGLGFARRRLIN